MALSGVQAGCADDVRESVPVEVPVYHHVPNDPVDKVEIGLSFIVEDTETACGAAVGVRVVVARGDIRHSCDAVWSNARVDGSEIDTGAHRVADCFFALAPGIWHIDTIEVLGDGGAPLACCSSRFTDSIEVLESQTTEVAADLLCDAPTTGAIDIYGWLDRPPVVVGLEVAPAKFVSGCTPVTLVAGALDPDGDPLWYTWDVVDAPAPADTWRLIATQFTAEFLATVAGTYQVRVTVTEPRHGTEASLTVPIHVLTNDATCLAPPEPPDHPAAPCVHSQGYWKNHVERWPLAVVTLGRIEYAKMVALSLLQTAPRGDATIILAHQLIAAKLNIASGAQSRRADELVFTADDMLTRAPVGTHASGTLGPEMTEVADELTAFNEGRLCDPDQRACVVCVGGL